MSKIVAFIKSCENFYVLTVNGDCPAGRPFGAIMEYQDDLYISTGDMKNVYKQIKKHSNIQILALKPKTRNWIRVNGIATECFDLATKQMMLEKNPILINHFSIPNAPHYALFKIKVVDYNIY